MKQQAIDRVLEKAIWTKIEPFYIKTGAKIGIVFWHNTDMCTIRVNDKQNVKITKEQFKQLYAERVRDDNG